MKEKTSTLNFRNLKSFSSSKTVRKIKRQAADWEKRGTIYIYTSHIYDYIYTHTDIYVTDN